MLNITTSILWLAMNAYFEASGESLDGKIAVTHVVLNRASAKNKSVKEILLEPKQFSWVPESKTLPKIKYPEDFIVCVKAVYDCLEQRLNGEYLEHADLYYNPDICSPYWAKDNYSIYITTNGNHIFKKEIK